MDRIVKRLTAITAILLLVLMICLCSASTAYGAMTHMIDQTGYMSDYETAELDAYFEQLSEELEFDIVGIMIAEGYDVNSLTATAEDFYDHYGYGYGSEKDGVIFAVDMRSRVMTMVTTGFGITAITDAYEEDIYDYVSDSLSSGYYSDAFEKYAERVRYYVLKARGGSGGGSTEGSSLPDAGTAAGMGGISLAAGAGAGLFSSQHQKSKLKTVRKKSQANSYARNDSLVLTRKQDRFLYSTVAVMPRPKNNNNQQGMGGGTTVHTGSSGTPHGGGHGRGF